MGAIGDQWVRKWGDSYRFLGGEGGGRCRHFHIVNVNLFNFILCAELFFNKQNWTPEFKVKFFYKVASRNKGWVMAYWFGFGGLTPFLVCKMFFAGFENDLCALKCAPSMREQSKLSMGHLESLLGRGHLVWQRLLELLRHRRHHHWVKVIPLALSIIVLLYTYLGSRGVLVFSARALSVQLK